LDRERPKTEDVTAQLEVLCRYRHFRGTKIRRLLGFVVNEWIADRGDKLTLAYIAKSLKYEPKTYEPDSLKWGYPKTRANLAHVRNRLRKYFESDGYRDPVIIKLNPGSYVPEIAYNPITTDIPAVEPEVARLILRAKTAIDMRTIRAARRALDYYGRIPFSSTNARQMANLMFIPMAVASILPSPMNLRGVPKEAKEMANEFLDELYKGLGNALTDIREKAVEEPWFGRVVNERQPEAPEWPQAKEQVSQEVQAPEQNKEPAPDLER
jgi:hypothetical protein